MRMEISGWPIRWRRSVSLFCEGGSVLEVVETEMPCYACMLGGEDGRTLFMLTAPTSLEPARESLPAGKLLVAEVDSPRAGRP